MLFVAHGHRRAGGRCPKGTRPAWCSAATLSAVDASTPEFLLAIAIAAGISMGTFAHADRHGSTHATAWGIGAFLAAGIVVPIYFVRFWLRKRRPTE